jgi:hypothetical protein
MASFSARATRRSGESRFRGSGRSSPSSSAPFVARLQSTAGNKAVAQLLTDGHDHGPIDVLGAHGNRAAASMLAPVQREDEKKETAAAGAAKPADTAKKDDAKGGSTKNLRKAWADAGLVAGGPLFDLINDDLSLAKLLDMGLPELGGLVGKGTEAAVDKATDAKSSGTGEIKPIGLSSKESGQVGGALAGWAADAAQKWLKTEDGRKFLAKAQNAINEHPTAAYWTIVSTLAVGIAGAVTGYCLGAFDPPEFKKQFEIRGVKIDAAADLGNVKEKVLQSGKLAISFKAGPGTLSISGSAKGVTEGKGKDAKQGDEYGASISYGVGDEKQGDSAKGTVGATYNTAKRQADVSLGAAFKFKPLTLDTTWKFQGDGSGVLDTSVTGKLSDKLTLSGSATIGAYGPASRDAPLGYKLALTSTEGKESEKVTLNLDPKTKDVSFGVEQTRMLFGGALTTSNTFDVAGGPAMAQGMSYARNALKADLKYSVDKAGKQTLDAGVSGKAEGLDAAFASKFDLDTGQIQQLTVHLGFTTPDETLKFLHDLAVQLAEGKVESKATETIKVRLRQIAVEIEGSIGEKNDRLTAGARAEVGWKLPAGVVVGAGVSASLTPGKDGVPAPWMVTPGVSVSHTALPIRLVGGVSVPVGAGSEGMAPVFGLSVAPNFDFWSEKKKKK